jgi:hypothetical protein
MNTGDTVRDDHGSSYEVGRCLGRGSWSRTYTARHAETGQAVVIKVPLEASDFPENDRLAAACRTIMAEQAKLSESGATPGLPKLLGRLDGTPGVVFAHAGIPLAEVASQGRPTTDLLELADRALDALVAITKNAPFHGNLTGANILVDDRGKVTLTDPITPTFRRHQAELYAGAATVTAHLAPELRGLESPLPLSIQSDTWSLSLQLVRAITVGQERFGSLPVDGLDKPRRVALKDQLLNRLRKEPSNAAFHGRLAERLVSLLNRALSRETSPSPPYRFRDLGELKRRVAEVRSLVHPTILNIGRLNWSLRAGADSFQTDEEVKFTLNVGCSHGVEGRDEIATGIALFDNETGDRIRDIVCAYSVDKHPSGRFRFVFKLTELRPGSFRVRVAFTIRDSGDEPTTSEGEFHVRPAPGYVPPRTAPSRSPIPLDRHGDEPVTQVTEPGVVVEPPTVVAPRLVRPGDSSSHRPRPGVDEEAPTVAVEPVLPTPIAPQRPRNLAPPPPSASARPSSPGVSQARHTTPPGPALRLTSPPPAGDPPSVDRPSSPGRPSYPGRASTPGMASTPPRSSASPRRPTAPESAPPPGIQLSPTPSSVGEHSGRTPGQRPPPPVHRASNRPSEPGIRPRATDPHARAHPEPSTVEVAERPSEPGPADLPDIDPSFPVMGSWMDIDVEEPTTRLDPSEELAPARRTVDHARHTPVPTDDDLGPVGAAVTKLVQLVRGDAYYMFLAVAIVLIVILGIALIAFRPPA